MTLCIYAVAVLMTYVMVSGNDVNVKVDEKIRLTNRYHNSRICSVHWLFETEYEVIHNFSHVLLESTYNEQNVIVRK